MEIIHDFQYFAPTRVVLEAGAAGKAGNVVASYGRKAMLVTLRDMSPLGFLEQVCADLRKASVGVLVYDEVEPNPRVNTVDAGAAIAHREGIGVVIALGGGSAIDAAKGIAVMSTHKADSIWDFVTGSAVATDQTLPIIAIPTTAGTGSEVSLGAVLSKQDELKKDSFGGVHIFPKVALVDPELMVSLPPVLTAVTGVDALAHSIEGYISLRANAISDTLALRSIELIAGSLRAAVANGDNIDARRNMALAATLGGMVLSQAGVGAAHALAMALGGRFNVGHGAAVSLFLADVIEYNLLANLEKFSRISQALGEDTGRLTLREAAEKSVAAIRCLAKDIGLNFALRDFGVTEMDIEQLAQESKNHPDMRPNPRKLTLEEITDIYRQAS